MRRAFTLILLVSLFALLLAACETNGENAGANAGAEVIEEGAEVVEEPVAEEEVVEEPVAEEEVVEEPVAEEEAAEGEVVEEEVVEEEVVEEEAAEGEVAEEEVVEEEVAEGEAAEASTGSSALVQLADGEMGQYLTDAEGRTLYGFAADEEGVSTCVDECAQTWPPLTVESEDELAVGEGLDEALLGTFEREDGTLQVTYNNHPLYYLTGEPAGEMTGQGSGGQWWLVDPTGEFIEQ